MSELSTIQLLIVDRQLSDIDSVVKILRDADQAVEAKHAADVGQCQALLNTREFDAVFVRIAEGLPSVEEVWQLLDQRRLTCALLALVDWQDSLRPVTWLRQGATDVVDFNESSHLVHALKRVMAERQLQEDASQAQRDNEELETRFRALFNSSSDAVAYIHEGAHMFANPVYQRLFGFASEEELQEKPLMNLVAARDQGRLKNLLRSVTKGELPAPLEVTGVTQKGQELPLRLTSVLTHVNEEPCLQLQIFTQNSITAQLANAQAGAGDAKGKGQQQDFERQRRALEAKIQELERRQQTNTTATQDFTGLLTRQAFTEELNGFFKGKEPKVGVLLYVLLTDYRAVIDNLGIEAADRLVMDLARLLRGDVASYSSASISHFADAVFVVFLPGTDLDNAREVAEIIAADIEQHTSRANHKLVATGCAIGLCPVQEYHEAAGPLIAQADRACDSARRRGRNQIALYEPGKGRGGDLGESKEIVTQRIKEAIAHDWLSALYQPIASFQGDALPRYKVYLRMVDSEGKAVDLERFAVDAERHGMMLALDKWLVNRMLEVLGESKAGEAVPQLFVRLSANALGDKGFCDWLSRRFEETQVKPQSLIIEFSEDGLQQQFDSAKVIRYRLKQLGCGFAVSHFGGKVNSERVLQGLTPNYIKLDIGLIERCVRGKDDTSRKALLKLVEISREMKINIIADSISNASQMASIYEFGIALVQGEMIQEPGAAMEFNFTEFAV
ncbi:MAG: EAL domain-containing protein [Candidatus Competibacterales bacterium]